MKKIELTEEQVGEAFKKAQSDEVKEMLTALFPDIANEITKRNPTLDDYKTITSYEDACEALGHAPVDFDMLWPNLPKHIVALMKLETISRALWGKYWQPKPDAEGNEIFYCPLFLLYTKEEVDRMTTQQTENLLFAYAHDEAFAGFGCINANGCSPFSYADFGFSLCQETEEKAKYFGGRNFINLWAEYLCFNFEVGDYLIQE